MKKIVRLTESDIVRLVKKVISENKKIIKEDEKVDNWVPIKLGQYGVLNIDGVNWKMKFPEQNGRDQYLVVKGLWKDGTELCVGNSEDWSVMKSYCMDAGDQKQFANKWYEAKTKNQNKFTLEGGIKNIEFVRA